MAPVESKFEGGEGLKQLSGEDARLECSIPSYCHKTKTKKQDEEKLKSNTHTKKSKQPTFTKSLR